jgi:hypothetical protein
MRHRSLTLAPIAMALALVTGAGPAQAGASFDFLFSMNHVSDDNQYFLNLAVSNYGYDRQILEPVLPRLRYVEVDLPVVLFLAKESGRPVDFIVDLRARGLAWSVILTRLELPADVLFVGIDRDPGPPYGRAWGHWKKSPRAVRLTDSDVAGLVQIQIGARATGLAPSELAKARGQGKRVVTLVADKRGRPYHKGKPAHAGHPGKGKPKGHGNH